jgi:hypothetical protein
MPVAVNALGNQPGLNYLALMYATVSISPEIAPQT